MQKLTLYQIAVVAVVAIALALTPAAFANSLTLDHYNGSLTLTSVANQGTVTLTDFAYIENTSTTKTLTIQGFEFYLGGTSVSGAANDTPTQFVAAANGWTYSLAQGDLAPGSLGTGWTNNTTPTSGQAVEPENAASKNYLSTVTLIPGTSGSGYCYIGEILGVNTGSLSSTDSCQIELQVTVNYGGKEGSKSDTFIYGYADGKMSGTGSNAANDSQFQGMEESIDIDVAPEPSTLMLLSTGLLGLAGLVRRRFVHR